MKKMLILLVLLTISLNLKGQDFFSRGIDYYSNGNYSDAITQFEAQIAYMETKSIDRNSDEYISVERLLSKSKVCLSISNKARKAFQKAELENTEDAYLKAIEAYERLLASNSKDRTARIRKSECQHKIDSIVYDRKVSEEWRIVDSRDTTSLEKFIERYPESKYTESAKKQIYIIKDSLAWINASTKEDYLNYIANYPDGTHVDNATIYIAHWDEFICWNTVLSKNTIPAYYEYMNDYPNGIFYALAEKNITLIQDDITWEEALETNTIQGFDTYMIRFPQGKHAYDALQNKTELENIKQIEYSNVLDFKKRPSLALLKEFEQKFPNSEYLPTIYDTYALFLCNNIDIAFCKKTDFKNAMSYARTKETKEIIKAKEKEWKKIKGKETGMVILQVVGYTVLGAAIIAGIVMGASRK